FVVTLSAPSGRSVTLAWSTQGLANASGLPVDVAPTSGTLTIPAGQVVGVISIPVKGDLLNEPDETFVLNLGSVTNATLLGGQTQAVGTILDDDALPSLSIADASVTEGDSGTNTATLTVTLSAASGQTVTVAYS